MALVTGRLFSFSARPARVSMWCPISCAKTRAGAVNCALTLCTSISISGNERLRVALLIAVTSTLLIACIGSENANPVTAWAFLGVVTRLVVWRLCGERQMLCAGGRALFYLVPRPSAVSAGWGIVVYFRYLTSEFHESTRPRRTPRP